MTYCVGVLLDDGIIFASDSRTHAGVDNFAKFCKMTVFERAGDRVIVLLSSGNLAGTQAVISVLKQRGEAGDGTPNLWTARTMFDVAVIVSDAMRDIERRDGSYLEESDVGFNASFILGGQIKDEPMRLFGSTPRAISSRPGSIRRSSRRARRSTASPSSIASSRLPPASRTQPSACWCRSIRPCAATCPWACRST